MVLAFRLWFRRPSVKHRLFVKSSSIFNAFGFNTYQDGWRGGNLADFGVSNNPTWMQWLPAGWIFQSCEGDMLLGNGSSRGATLDG